MIWIDRIAVCAAAALIAIAIYNHQFGSIAEQFAKDSADHSALINTCNNISAVKEDERWFYEKWICAKPFKELERPNLVDAIMTIIFALGIVWIVGRAIDYIVCGRVRVRIRRQVSQG